MRRAMKVMILEVVQFWDEIPLDGTFLDGDARCHCSDG